MRRVLLALVLGWLSVSTSFAQAPAIGDAAPVQLGKDKDGKIVDLSAYRGKLVIVTFWASWCPQCLKELPVLEALQQKVGDQWLQVIAVNVQDPNDVYRQMTRQMRGYRTLLVRDRSGDIAQAYDVRAYPNLWIIDRQGRIAARHLGYGEHSLERIVNDIQRILREEITAATPAG